MTKAVSGRDYLEKIVQVPVELPSVPEQVLLSHLTTALNTALMDIEDGGPFDEQAWPDILMEIVRPLVNTPRDAIRYAAAAHGTIFALDGQVAMTDVLALEAVKTFMPDVFSRILGSVDALTDSDDELPLNDGGQRFKAQIKDLIEAAGEPRGAVVRGTDTSAFPHGQKICRRSRIRLGAEKQLDHESARCP